MSNALKLSLNNIPRNPWLLSIIIFLIALAARIPSLGVFFTADEPLWVQRSHEFTAGLFFSNHACSPVDYGRSFATTGWGCTYQIGYPGATTMWGGALGLLIYYWQQGWAAGIGLQTFLENLVTDPVAPDLIAAMRLPLAIAGASFPALFFLILSRLINRRIALISALLVALHPFHIALSRVIHHDALTTTFMVLSLLTMIGYWLRGWRWYWLVVSAALAGLGFLTKSIAWFMMPCAAMVATLGLYYRWQCGQWRGWSEIWRWMVEGVLWGLIAWLTFSLFFPAMWVIPAATIEGLISVNFELGLEGHKNGQYFLGQVPLDPGPLFYPVGWLFRTSPLDLIGLLTLPFITWRLRRSSSLASLRQQLNNHPVTVALILFLAFFLIFETISSKKMIRYFLPAFPIIHIFIASGLLWLSHKLTEQRRNQSLSALTTPLLVGVIILVQSWFIYNHSPYYFTYYNPLLGGPAKAAQLITIDGWGEGLNEVGEYLNRQPNASTLKVRSWYPDTLAPFFAGQVSDFSIRAGKLMSADYLVYYQNQLQRNLQKNIPVWTYFDQYHSPVDRVVLHNLDYALVYRNPIENHVDWTENSLSDKIMIFGYNLSSGGDLTLFWQNLGLETNQETWVALAAASGGEESWLACPPPSGFAPVSQVPETILESACVLEGIAQSPGLYDLQIALQAGQERLLVPFPAGRLAISINEQGDFAAAEQETGLTYLLEQQLPDQAIPLDIQYGDLVSLVGYQIEAMSWESGQTEQVRLYWQPLQQPDLGLAGAFELQWQLSTVKSPDPKLVATTPIFPTDLVSRELKLGQVVPIPYTITLPKDLSSGEHLLQACLTLSDNGQLLSGTKAETGESVECLSVSVYVDAL